MRNLISRRLVVWTIAFGCLCFPSINQYALAQSPATEEITVVGEEVPSAYGAPPAFSRSRFTPLLNAYVLPPWAVYTSVIYEGDALKFNRPDHSFTEEIEVGLPARFGVAFENETEGFRGTWQERSASIEARYAFADWDKYRLIQLSSLNGSSASVTFCTMKVHPSHSAKEK